MCLSVCVNISHKPTVLSMTALSMTQTEQVFLSYSHTDLDAAIALRLTL